MRKFVSLLSASLSFLSLLAIPAVTRAQKVDIPREWIDPKERRGQADPNFDVELFVSNYAVMGAQRATKILGLFTRLDRRDGKPQYLKLLPRIEQTLARNLAHPALEPLRRWFEAHLPRALGAPAEE